MINKINLKNVATFVDETFQPSVLNFVYGSNGTGKTTISEQIRLGNGLDISDEERDTEYLIYNRKFKEENFRESQDLKGVFTLGEDSVEKKDRIAELDSSITQCELNIANQTKSLKSVEASLDKEIEAFYSICWTTQQVLKDEFPKALDGYKGSKKKFAEKCLKTLESYPDQISEQDNEQLLNDLKKKYSAVYSDQIHKDVKISSIDINNLDLLDDHNIVCQPIIGSDNSQISDFIDFLGNSKWMREGLSFLDKANGRCPYCQQPLQDDFRAELEKYFDNDYLKRIESLEKLRESYVRFLNDINSLSDRLEEIDLNYLDLTDLRKLIRSAEGEISNCIKILDDKIQDPSLSLTLTPPKDIIVSVDTELKSINDEIEAHNQAVDNLSHEIDRFKERLWLYISGSLQSEIKSHESKKKGMQKGIQNINSKIEKEKEEERVKTAEKIALESGLSSTKKTIDDINSILKSFGYTNFKLSESSEEENAYSIIRENGEDARKSLSEGEFTFITFLYFYHLCYGSENSENVGKNKIVVIDDPISSLDSNVLFIVSILTKNILMDAAEGRNHISQVFVLTHNLYYYKEASFYGSRSDWPSKKTKYFLIKKIDNVSHIESYEHSPVSTTYEILWKQVATKESPDLALNAMRRILEHYFNIIGGYNYDELINKLEGTDKIVCRSLVANINDGSHSVFDCYDYSVEYENIESYCRVFKMIFEFTGQLSHFNMMMNKFGGVISL